MMLVRVFTSFLLLSPVFVLSGEDYYKLLGIKRNADTREIRKAFKKLALKLHPDKNDEEGAHEKFLKINRAYEVLKDDELRKKYDMYGDEEEESNNRGRNYQSWKYYNDDFGIYDDDIDIVTLDSNEFRRSVMESHDVWFINFYSPRCGHCHDLAPTWRKLAKEVAGSVRVGAVNCQEESWLCRQQGITGYPKLLLYTMGEGTQVYRGHQEYDDLLTFLASRLHERIVDLWPGNFDKWTKGKDHRFSSWLIYLCPSTSSTMCLEHNTRRFLGAGLSGITSIGMVDCSQDKDLCVKLLPHDDEEQDTDVLERPIALFFPEGVDSGNILLLESDISDHKEVIHEVLGLLPEPTQIDTTAFDEMRRRLEAGSGPSWMIHFHLGDEGQGLEWRKLAPLLPRMRIGQVDCDQQVDICAKLSVSKFPAFAVFKVGGGMEMNYGKSRVAEIILFSRLSTQARTMQSLSADMFPSILQKPVVIDFFTPWCPPCMNFLPEFRKGSTIIGGDIIFGTVDCTIHGRLCNQHGVKGYPTTIFFNNSKPHKYQGSHDAKELADFVHDTLKPSVVHLNAGSFSKLVSKKAEKDIWVVDFFAPWCGPCQALAPEWRKLARSVAKIPGVHIGQVDCDSNKDLCDSQAIRSYPSIRLYPSGSSTSGRYTPLPQGVNRDAASLEQWLMDQLPSKVEGLTPYSFKMLVLGKAQPWLIDFYTPWCGHCKRFAPVYEQVAMAIPDGIRVGKVDCERYQKLCRQEKVTGYPTLRFYQGSDKDDEHFFADITSQDADVIIETAGQYVDQKNTKQSSLHDEL